MARIAGSPRDAVAGLEAGPGLAGGDIERFSGYGVMGTYFPSGDVLALRRFAISSVGPGYSSVWHRDRTGRWVFYQDVLPHLGCARYFGGGLAEAIVTPVRIVWSDAFSFTVIIGHGRGLEWRVELARGGRTRVLGRMAARLPAVVWRNRVAARGLAAAAGAALGAGRLRLEGRTSDAYRFLARPVSLWQVASSRAVIGGRDTGDAVAPAEQVRLGDFWVPARGLFAVAHVEMRRED